MRLGEPIKRHALMETRVAGAGGYGEGVEINNLKYCEHCMLAKNRGVVVDSLLVRQYSRLISPKQTNASKF